MTTNKFLITISAFVALAISSPAQDKKEIKADRKFQMKIENYSSVGIQKLQEKITDEEDDAETRSFGDNLRVSFGSMLSTRAVNISANLLSLIVDAIKGDQQKWLKAVQAQCSFSKELSSDTKISDFYAAPSERGPMDPENLCFKGFGCRSFLECQEDPTQGREVFLLACKLRTDSLGIAHMVNHSKFMVEIDSLTFDPYHCNLPNDSTGKATNRFSFEKRKDLMFSVTIKVFSSWINEYAQISNDQQIGEFTITAKIDQSKLNENGVFIYDKNDPDFEKLVAISGDCFLVPRSYIGNTKKGDKWGTGEYRVEMTVSESCQINTDYYYVRPVGNGQEVAYANSQPGREKWDKDKWKTEWTEMQADKNSSFIRNAWSSIVNTCRGTGWIETFTDPIGTALYEYETEKLNDWLDLTSETDAAMMMQ